MRLRQVGKHLGEKLETDQEAVQRVFVQIIATAENAVEQFAILPQVAQQQTLGEFALILEVIEEAAFGNTGRRDQLLDRGGGKSFGEHCAFGELKQSFARVAGFAGRNLEHGALYHGCSW